jgi:SAM-dependent methyltransferase
MTQCNICGARTVEPVADFGVLRRVSSDCKPVGPGGELGECQQCGAIQKPLTAALAMEIAKIYAHYDIYYQGGGAEQLVLDDRDGIARRRSQVIVDRLSSAGWLDHNGASLDVGCGNGSFLASIAEKAAGWRLYGLDLDDRYASQLALIPGFKQLILENVQNHSGTYDFISAIHALEHFTDPYAGLTAFRRCLGKNGKLFIQVPNLDENPFDLLIADHISHFTPRSLARLLDRAGLRVLSLATNWIGKEISVVAAPADGAASIEAGREKTDIAAHVAWLNNVRLQAVDLAQRAPIGIFGTSIAGTWLAGSLGTEHVAFFVDEDPARQGRTHFGNPVLAPRQVPSDSTVFICLASATALKIAARMVEFGFCCVTPLQEK